MKKVSGMNNWKNCALAALIACLIPCAAVAQEMDVKKCTAIVVYEKGQDGLYECYTDTTVQEVKAFGKRFYAYDKKNRKLYMASDFGNYVFELNPKAKVSKSVPRMKERDIIFAVDRENMSLLHRFALINERREREMADSIERAERRIRLIRAQQRQDSIQRAQDSLRLVAKERYRETHNMKWFPKSKTLGMECLLCHEKNKDDSVYVAFLKGDTIFYTSPSGGELGLYYTELHATLMDNSVKLCEPFMYHYDIFKDSLTVTNDFLNLGNTALHNMFELEKHWENLRKKAPYGFVYDWRWSGEDWLSKVYFEYFNTNKQRVKYIDVSYATVNEVGDIVDKGTLHGVGPIESMDTSAWRWECVPTHPTSSKMRITRIVLTYMNGRKVTLNGNQIKYK